MTKPIEHPGKVISVSDNKIVVEIVSSSACSGCRASAVCSASELKKKYVEIITQNSGYKAGDAVTVCMAGETGIHAVVISYVIPLFVFIIAVLSSSYAGFGELTSGLFSVAVLAVYFFAVFLLRKKIERKYRFYIKG